MTFQPPPGSSAQHAAGMADAAHAAHARDRMQGAENLAELKAMNGSRLTKLLARFAGLFHR